MVPHLGFISDLVGSDLPAAVGSTSRTVASHHRYPSSASECICSVHLFHHLSSTLLAVPFTLAIAQKPAHSRLGLQSHTNIFLSQYLSSHEAPGSPPQYTAVSGLSLRV